MDHLSVGGQSNYMEREVLSAAAQCGACGVLYSAAARHFHTDDSQAFHGVLPQNFSQLFAVVCVIQLWAADQCDFTLHKCLMEIAVGISGTVGGN